MQVTETTTEGLRREFQIVVPKDDIETRMLSRLREVGQSVNVPGFRPGKAPIPLLKKRFGEALRGEILEQTIQESSNRAIEDNDLRPAMQPSIEIVTFEDGADLEFKMKVEVLPEIDPVDFSEIELERLVADIPDSDVDQAVGRIAEQQKSFSAQADRAAESGDQLLMSFVGKIDGEAFDGGTAEGMELELGSNRFIPGFEDQLVGVKAGESREVKVSFPEDYPAENLKGKDAVFDVTVSEVRVAGAVEVDEDFAKSVGAESLDALKGMLREQIGNEYTQISKSRLKRELLDALAERCTFDVPPGMLDAEFESIWKQLEQAKENDRLDEDDKGKTDEELTERYREIAQRRLRLGLLLSEIGRTSNLSVSQEDLNRAISEQAQRFPGQEAQVMRYYQENPQAMQELQAPIFEDKIIDYILELAKVTDRKVSTEELLADPDEAGDDTAAAKKGGKKAKTKSKGKAKAKGK